MLRSRPLRSTEDDDDGLGVLEVETAAFATACSSAELSAEVEEFNWLLACAMRAALVLS